MMEDNPDADLMETEDDDDLLSSSEEDFEDDEVRETNDDFMSLSQTEIEWAKQLRRAHLASTSEDSTTPNVPLCDMEYALHAIACEGNLQLACQKIEGIQRFRELYHIKDTVEEGISHLEEFIQLMPGFLLHIDVSADRGEAVRVFNYAALNPSVALSSERNFQVTLLFEYYCETMEQPNLSAVREGVSYMCETHDMTWNNFSMQFEERLCGELLQFAPGKLKNFQVYNSNSIANMTWSLCKRLLGFGWWEKTQLGCQVEFNTDPALPKITLSDIFLQPDFDGAMQNVVRRARKLLQMRYRNQQTFRLPPDAPVEEQNAQDT